MDFDTPEGRLAAAEALGPEGYNRAIKDHHERSTVETVNGHGIRPVASRFGRLFMVGKTGSAFPTLSAAREYAEQAKPGDS